ncbi:FACT complex subunit SPT16, putative, partial [Hepatocystis sp. ex Piliocolobus tephrosceles]
MSELDVENAKEKINIIFSYWKGKDSGDLSNSNVFCVLSGKSSKDENSTVQEQFQMWFLGYQLTETFFIFLKSEKLIILTSDKKKKFLQPLLDTSNNIEILDRTPDNSENFEEIKKQIEESNTTNICILKDADASGSFFDSCYNFLNGLNKTKLDINNNIKPLLNYRSESDLKIQKSGGDIACLIIKNILITTIENSLDEEIYESHNKIKEKALNFQENKKCVSKLKEKLKVDIDDIDILYSNVQSGTIFSLNFKNSSDNNSLSQKEGTILVGLGLKYKELCCNINRTLLLNAKNIHKELYTFTLVTHKYIIKECLIVNSIYADIYKKVIDFIKNKKKEYSNLNSSIPNIENYFVKSIGHVIGIEFLDKKYILSETNTTAIIDKNVTYNISVGFENVKGNGSSENFSTWISDTICINNKGEVIVLTEGLSKEINTVSYELEDDESGEEEDEEDGDDDDDDDDDEDSKEKKKKNKKDKSIDTKNESKDKNKKKIGISATILNNASSVIVSDRLRRRNKNSLAHTNEQEMEGLNKRQLELKEKKINEIKLRFSNKTDDPTDMNKKNIKKMEDLKAYNDIELLPREMKTNKIVVDNKHECILLPINGAHVPFHVSTIKNLSSNYEDNNDIFVLRINFLIPGIQGVGKGELNTFPELKEKEMYIKELIFKSHEEHHFQIIVKQVKELIKQVKQKQVEADVIDSANPHEKLMLNKSGRRIILRDLMTRPNLFTGGRKILGTLELHTNGVRYSANSRGTTEFIDILFDDIKYAFYQPCDGQLIILIHFHLKRYVMVGKKKTLDIQFYCEAGTQIDDLDRAKARNAYDPDEMHDEIKEREQKNRLNLIFKNFVQQMQDNSKLEFEIPYPELTFSGVPNKSNVEIYVTANTINHLVEWPPFILAVEDIEIASLERVHRGLRNFDMIFVFKDYTKPVKRIDVIPTEHIDMIKKWLTTIDIVYYEGKNNLQWSNILKTILSDIDAFVSSKGFDGFLGEGDGEDDESADDEDEDDDYEIDDSEMVKSKKIEKFLLSSLNKTSEYNIKSIIQDICAYYDDLKNLKHKELYFNSLIKILSNHFTNSNITDIHVCICVILVCVLNSLINAHLLKNFLKMLTTIFKDNYKNNADLMQKMEKQNEANNNEHESVQLGLGNNMRCNYTIGDVSGGDNISGDNISITKEELERLQDFKIIIRNILKCFSFFYALNYLNFDCIIDIINILCEYMSINNVDNIIIILKICGMKLKSEDMSHLEYITNYLKQQVDMYITKNNINIEKSKLRFLIKDIEDLKNNKMKFHFLSKFDFLFNVLKEFEGKYNFKKKMISFRFYKNFKSNQHANVKGKNCKKGDCHEIDESYKSNSDNNSDSNNKSDDNNDSNNSNNSDDNNNNRTEPSEQKTHKLNYLLVENENLLDESYYSNMIKKYKIQGILEKKIFIIIKSSMDVGECVNALAPIVKNKKSIPHVIQTIIQTMLYDSKYTVAYSKILFAISNINTRVYLFSLKTVFINYVKNIINYDLQQVLFLSKLYTFLLKKKLIDFTIYKFIQMDEKDTKQKEENFNLYFFFKTVFILLSNDEKRSLTMLNINTWSDIFQVIEKKKMHIATIYSFQKIIKKYILDEVENIQTIYPKFNIKYIKHFFKFLENQK